MKGFTAIVQGVFVIVCLVPLGCKSTSSPGPRAGEVDAPRVARVRYLDRRAERHADILRHAATRTDAGLLQVKVLLENDTRGDAWVTIKCAFLDQDGFEVEATNNEAIFLPSRREQTYVTTSIATGVYDYILYIDNWSTSSQSPRDTAR